MSNEILFPANTVGNYKAVVSKGATVWNGTAMAATSAAAKASGAITLTRQGTTLDYVGSFPAGIVVPGKFTLTVIDAATPAGTEPPVGAGDIDWSGSAEVALANTDATTNAIAGYVDTEVAAIKAKTDNLPAVPASDTTVAAVKAVTDKLAFMISGITPNYVFTGAALVNAPASAGGGAITLDMTQAIPTGNSPGTVGDALNAARAQGFGKWVKSGTTLTLYAPDGTTVVRTFTLDDSTTPTSRV